MPKQKSKEKKDKTKPEKVIKKKEKGKKKKKDTQEEDSVEEVITTNFSEPSLQDGEIKIVTWNVCSYRNILKRGFEEYLVNENPHIILLNETKISSSSVKKNEFPGYFSYFYSGDKTGYSGTALITKTDPISISYGIGIEEHDNEGRVITAEYDDFILVCSYIPNSGVKLKRLDYRKKWDEDFLQFLLAMKEKKPVIWCGDLNVAHKPIDLKNPTKNTKTAGFSKEERENFQKVLDNGFVDSYRHFYPTESDCYTFWSNRFGCRARNTGWRLDYFVVTENLLSENRITNSYIRKYVMGSDHCPIVLHLKSSIAKSSSTEINNDDLTTQNF